jgi:hypothetical protein
MQGPTQEQKDAAIGIAHERFCGNEDVRVDSDEDATSEADKGLWVRAWVWVADTDIETIVGNDQEAT